MIKNFTQDQQSITSDWDIFNQSLIYGVEYKETKTVIKDSGTLTELFRPEWFSDANVAQVFRVTLYPNAISGWHAHLKTIDRLSILTGSVKIVLYDDRPESPTYQQINVFKIAEVRPGTVLIPPGVWHAVQNLHPNSSSIVNMVDTPYQYEQPDHVRIPINDPQIPYFFELKGI